MRDFIATPFFLLTNIFGYLTAIVSGKQIMMLVVDFDDEDDDDQ